eukprot:6657230-Pyramimonas_sp.AAC.1
MISVPVTAFWKDSGLRGCNRLLIRGVGIPEMALWHDSGSSRRSNQVDPWRSPIGGLHTAQFHLWTCTAVG